MCCSNKKNNHMPWQGQKSFPSVYLDCIQQHISLLLWQSLCQRLCHRKRLMPYFLKLQRNPPKNTSIMESLSENLDKNLYFSAYCRDKTTTCHDRAKKIFPAFIWNCIQQHISLSLWQSLCQRLCHRSGWCLISWNSKGIPQKMPQSWSPSAKILIKPVFSVYCRGKTTTCPDRALPKTAYVFYRLPICWPHSSAFFQWLCHKNGWRFFPWSSKGITGKMP